MFMRRQFVRVMRPEAWTALFVMFVASPSVLAFCYTLRSPQPGYIAGAEQQPCTAFLANGCDTYLHCPPGSKCEWALVGRSCNQGSLVVAMDVYEGGSPSAGLRCCRNGTLDRPHPTLTCTIPNDSLGSRCPFMDPIPE